MKTGQLKIFWKNRDLRSRLFVVMGILVVYSLLTHVPAPVPNVQKLQSFLLSFFNSSPVLGFTNLFTGGALGRFSIIAMGIGPYITASIIVQLLQQVVPSWEALAKEGERGQKKLNQYMRMLTVPMAVIQSFTVVALVRQISSQSTGADLIGNPSIWQWLLLVLSLTAGSMFLMWLGELITEKGFGNGISLIIAAGIISSLPSTFASQISLLQGDGTQAIKLIVLAGLFLVTTFGVVMVNEAQRNIPISYARRSAAIGQYGSVDTHLPLRLITAGVIPVIFALTFLSVPTFLGQLFEKASTPWVASLATSMKNWFSPTSWTYTIAYFVLIFVFTFFYTSIIFKPKEIAENLQKQGGFVPGIRPGRETAKYLGGVISRLNLSGATALGIIAVLPLLVERWLNTSQAVAIGGTSVFILVSVAIETKRQVDSRVLMATYDKY